MTLNWQWFLAHGDKLLLAIAAAVTTLELNGTIPASSGAHLTAVIAAVAALLHVVILPEPTPVTPPVQAPKA